MKSVFVVSVLVALVGLTVAKATLKDLLEVLRELDHKDTYERELQDEDAFVTRELLTLLKRQGNLPGCTGCRNILGFKTGERAGYLCDNLVRGQCPATMEYQCRYNCGPCTCDPQDYNIIQTKKSHIDDETLGKKLLSGYKRMIQDI